jgi:hypothetical protein
MMNISDIGIAVCSIGLVVFTLPILFNRKAMVPRKTSSLPVAVFLTAMVPFFLLDSLYLTACTLTGQALTWWAIVKWRPVK